MIFIPQFCVIKCWVWDYIETCIPIQISLRKLCFQAFIFDMLILVSLTAMEDKILFSYLIFKCHIFKKGMIPPSNLLLIPNCVFNCYNTISNLLWKWMNECVYFYCIFYQQTRAHNIKGENIIKDCFGNLLTTRYAYLEASIIMGIICTNTIFGDYNFCFLFQP